MANRGVNTTTIRQKGAGNREDGITDAPYPFEESLYASNLMQCDTMIVIWSRMLREAVDYDPDDRGDATTFVSIFDARTKKLVQIAEVFIAAQNR